MADSYLNKKVSVRGERGVVIGERSKKGKLRLTVRFDSDSRTEEMGYGLVILQEVCGPRTEFAPAENWNDVLREAKAQARYHALRNIGAI